MPGVRSSFESTVGDGSMMECTTEEARGVLGSRCGSVRVDRDGYLGWVCWTVLASVGQGAQAGSPSTLQRASPSGDIGPSFTLVGL